MSRSHVFALGITVLLTAIAVAQDTAATKSQPQPCSAPEQKQMDFLARRLGAHLAGEQLE